MKIYKTWNIQIAQILPAFRQEEFIVFVPETNDEKNFLYNFFSFLSSFTVNLQNVLEGLKNNNIVFFDISYNQFQTLFQTDKFFLITAIEEYIVPRDTFLALLKLIKLVLSEIQNQCYTTALNNMKLDIPEIVPKAFKIEQGKIKLLNSFLDDKNIQDSFKSDFEDELIRFINLIEMKFEKRKKQKQNKKNN